MVKNTIYAFLETNLRILSFSFLNENLNAPKLSIGLTREWTKIFPSEAGIYLLWENGELCYVGETGSIRGRMQNLLNTLNHQVRRSIANRHLKNHEGFVKGSSTLKHPDEIEKLLDALAVRSVKRSALRTLDKEDFNPTVSTSSAFNKTQSGRAI